MSEERIGQDDIEDLLRQAQAAAKDDGPQKPEPPAKVEEDDSAALGQNEIEALFGGGGAAKPKPAKKPAAQPAPEKPAAAVATAPKADSSPMQAGDIDMLLDQAQAALDSAEAPYGDPPPDVRPFPLTDFTGTPPSTERTSLNLLSDVELDLKIELGRTNMHLEDVLQLRKGSVVPLDKLAGDPVDIYVNGRLIAYGEVLVLNDNFCVRVAELIAGDAAG